MGEIKLGVSVMAVNMSGLGAMPQIVIAFSLQIPYRYLLLDLEYQIDDWVKW